MLCQSKTKQKTNSTLIRVDYVLKSRKPRFSGVGNPVEFPACVVAPGNTHFNSDMSEVGPVGAAEGNLQVVFVSGISIDGDTKSRNIEGMCLLRKRK